MPDLVVLHHTAMTNAAAALERLCDPAAEVSSHYLIGEGGEVWHLVDEEMRAWHAGAGQWGGVCDVNSRSIGIELVNTGAHPYPWPQMAALECLMRAVMKRWRIPPERVIAHSDMAPGRKADPGPRFDWRGLAQQGLSVWPEGRSGAMETDMARFVAQACAFGYPEGVDARALLEAFRLRFRPWAEGPLEPVDIALSADLAARFPVDPKDRGS